MKVLCIADKHWSSGLPTKDASVPKYGETYTVVETIKEENTEYYILSEFPEGCNNDGTLDMWDAKYFIPISEQEEELSAEIELLEYTK